MTDIELQGIIAVVIAETSAMKTENDFRLQVDLTQAYTDNCITGTDAMKCLETELRRRGVLVTP